jgi:transposase-like protein
VPAPDAANAEFSALPRRRTFTAPDKLRILADVDRAASAGGIGAVLRRQGLYSSTLSDWGRLRDAGAFGALTPALRSRKGDEIHPLTVRVALLQNEMRVWRCA